MLRRFVRFLLCSGVLLICTAGLCKETKHNVLFIAVDDLNDWVGHLGGHPQAKTPNLDRLAARGVSFTRAYCNAPICNPSRVSLLTGKLPTTNRYYSNGSNFRGQLPNAVSLPQYFRQHGFATQGGGKIFHGTQGKSADPLSWDDYFVASRPKTRQVPRKTGLPKSAWAPWGPLDVADEETADVKMINWAISQLQSSPQKPFFLACGFKKPHLPWYAPRKYFDLHPLEDVILPKTLESDRDDLPAFGQRLAREVQTLEVSGDPGRNYARHGEDHDMVLKHDQWRRAVQSYLATISFIDAHLGRLLDALEASEHADNTIIVLWGDHGWHLGEKQHWRKHALWETTTRTPLIWAMPTGDERIVPGQKCDRPVSLVDIYPTLVELCGLPTRDDLDGHSLTPLLKNPSQAWEHPAITTFGKNHAVRTDRWRYIRYLDGGEELYDHMNDPDEWNNLAADSGNARVIAKLQKLLPQTK